MFWRIKNTEIFAILSKNKPSFHLMLLITKKLALFLIELEIRWII